MILAIDTANSLCSVCLGDNNSLLDIIEETESSQQSKKLFPMIDELLIKNNLKLSDISELALSVGPGSFTGVRIGISAISGMKIANNNFNIISVSTLQAVASSVKSTENFAVILDASRQQVYIQIFNNNSQSISEMMLMNYEESLKLLQDEDINYIYGSAVNYESYDSINKEYIIPNAKCVLDAAFMVKNNIINNLNLEPIYIREANITKPKQLKS